MQRSSFGHVTVLQFNFVGRILGPRGMTTKQIEQNTGCKIMIRGKGSMRDRKKVSYQAIHFTCTVAQGAPKTIPQKKRLYFSNSITDLSQTFRLYM